MKTYREHYEHCKSLYNSNSSSKYKSVYDLRVDSSFLDNKTNSRYYELIDIIRNKLDYKIEHKLGTFTEKHAIRVNDWFDIKELNELVDIFMPVVEEEILGCNGKIEFLHPYRNIPLKEGREESSWTWHYDDCPDEFLKFFVYLNPVTENSGCLKYIKSYDGSIPKVKTYNTVAGIRSTAPPVYERSRIPNSVVKEELDRGGKVVDVVGKAGSYAICTPNIYHRASVPDPDTEPRDVLFFFIRPSIKKYKDYLQDTFSYLPAKNVKMYSLD